MSRQLLQNIRDSGCVDMESLCILAHQSVRRQNFVSYDILSLNCTGLGD